jgi:hypothetical protein
MVKTLWLASLSIISGSAAGLIPVPATATATTTAASASVLVRSTARDGCCCDREITTRARWNVQRRGLCLCVDRRLLSGLSRRHTLAFQDQDGAARCLSSVSCVMQPFVSLVYCGGKYYSLVYCERKTLLDGCWFGWIGRTNRVMSHGFRSVPSCRSLSPVLVPFASAYSHGSMTQPKLPAAFLCLFGFAWCLLLCTLLPLSPIVSRFRFLCP